MSRRDVHISQGAVTLALPPQRAIRWELMQLGEDAPARATGAICGVMVRKGWPGGARPRLRGGVLDFGARCYDLLLDAGWTEEDVWTVGLAGLQMLSTAAAPPSEEDVKAAEGFSVASTAA